MKTEDFSVHMSEEVLLISMVVGLVIRGVLWTLVVPTCPQFARQLSWQQQQQQLYTACC